MSLLRTVLNSLLFLLCLILVVWLVYSNTEPVPLKLVWLAPDGIDNPFRRQGQSDQILLPLGLWLVVFTVLGLIVGLLCGWFIGGATRIRARRQSRRARQAEQELQRAREQGEAAKTQVDALKTEKKILETQIKQANRLPAAASTPASTPNEVKQLPSA